MAVFMLSLDKKLYELLPSWGKGSNTNQLKRHVAFFGARKTRILYICGTNGEKKNHIWIWLCCSCTALQRDM